MQTNLALSALHHSLSKEPIAALGVLAKTFEPFTMKRWRLE